jgi:hypothetical protein
MAQAHENDFGGEFTLPSGVTIAEGNWISFQYNGVSRFGQVVAYRPSPKGGFGVVVYVGEIQADRPNYSPQSMKDFKTFGEHGMVDVQIVHP